MGQSPGHKTIYSKSKSRHGVTLTDDAWARMQAIANRLGVSVSELLERIGRNQLAVVEPHTPWVEQDGTTEDRKISRDQLAVVEPHAPEQPLSKVQDLQSGASSLNYQTHTVEQEGLIIFTSLPEADAYSLENAVELMREERTTQLLNGM